MSEIFTIKDKNINYNNFNEYIEIINNKNELYDYINGITLHMLCNKQTYEQILKVRMNTIIDYYIDANINKEPYINYYKNNIIDNLKNISITEYAQIYRETNKIEETDDDDSSVDSDILIHYKCKFPTEEMLKEYYHNLYKNKYYYHEDSDYDIYSDNIDNYSECETYYSYDNENYDDIIYDEQNNDYYTDDEY
jgi:hypothetical protein